MIPFSAEAYGRLVVSYLADHWPAALAGSLLALIAIGLAARPRAGSDRFIAAALAGFWLWTGIAFHALALAMLLWAAWGFAALFLAQGLLLARIAVARAPLAFRWRAGPFAWAGGILALSAAGLGGLLVTAGSGAGAEALALAAAGVAVTPGPLALFTLALLLWAEPRAPLHLAAIPLVWCLLAGATGWALGLLAEAALLILAPGACVLLLWKHLGVHEAEGEGGTQGR